ncbi:MAG: DUF4411 family protein [Candidatus Bathyarchaeota archaeon]|uniref:DUF4411 family protein n=1 Tax=Candidatus Bathycorpusculum sp. TaxID=2994959 RepID=UPI0028383AFA|nr:DUF4411 family protein [Candidatus Termiticorpusculum sp.]MCL2258187.1 DUF4411 family protein [Candidatus Termiticorpusculum sp.]MCL2291479.1 DUF4411 family protein [Candidatus Termiticorpusculum sp.]
MYNRAIHKTLWNNIEQLMRKKNIVACSDISNELEKDEILRDYLTVKQCEVLEVTQSIPEEVTKIVNEHPKLLKFTGTSTGTSSGDAFLIATAMFTS